MKLVHIPTHFVAQIWEKVCPFIANALEYAQDDYTIDQVRVYLSTGQWIMIVASNEINEVVGASTITFHNYPNDRVAFVTTVGGKFISDTDTYNQFKEILKGFGATKIQGAARKSIARLWRTKLGFKERHIIVEAKI
jgi:hypothetical protein